jgi:hypothetical protein
LFLFLAVVGFELSASHLIGRYFVTWATQPQNFFCFLVIFQVESHVFTYCQPQTMILLSTHSWDDRHMSPVLFYDGSLTTFWPGLAWTTFLLLSTSQVAGITDVSHHVPEPMNAFLEWQLQV